MLVNKSATDRLTTTTDRGVRRHPPGTRHRIRRYCSLDLTTYSVKILAIDVRASVRVKVCCSVGKFLLTFGSGRQGKRAEGREGGCAAPGRQHVP